MKLSACAIGLAMVVTGARVASADSAKADEKFRLGKKLLAQKHYTEACAAFEDSNKLDPGIGAELNIGHCYEEWGKLATAYRAYIAAEEMAKTARDPRLPRFGPDARPRPAGAAADDRCREGHSTKGLVVTLDGEPFAKSDLGNEQRVDPGPHRLEYRVATRRRATSSSLSSAAATRTSRSSCRSPTTSSRRRRIRATSRTRETSPTSPTLR